MLSKEIIRRKYSASITFDLCREVAVLEEIRKHGVIRTLWIEEINNLRLKSVCLLASGHFL